jgi:rhamnosyltransferase
MILVSTSGIQDSDLDKMPARVEYLQRPNFGYDFFSYKWGLDIVGDYQDFDRVLVVNDSFVGPVVPVMDILDHPNCQDIDFAGMTLSQSHHTHVQSFFFVFGAAVAKSNGFRRFWKDMVPVSDRMRVIQDYEIGLTKSVVNSGFKVGSYFRPSIEEHDLGRRRWKWFLQHRLSLKHPGTTMWDVAPAQADLDVWNPAVNFADRILGSSRLPILKFDALRYDPYELGADNLLSLCEAEFPEQLAGVREFLRMTEKEYPIRPGEMNIKTGSDEKRMAAVGYGMV